ncbi:major centromere autoantigen B-like [Cyanistes caeruleus]|uniref:major centromere autoantigen B-like n=1 Tax=Cyanistes caeruleus TaxID=156563 RepID=UPI000CDA70B0|nr:major centromere autoantigen B-like [Cyanistes caeruleus]
MEQRPPRIPKLAWVEEEEKEEEEGPGAAPDVETEEVQEFQPLEEGWESVGDLEQRPPRVPKLAWVEEEDEEEEEGPGAAPEVEIEEVQEFQPLEEDSAMDQTQEQGLACGLFHGTAQEETSVMGTGSMEDGDVYTSDTSAAMLEFILEEGVSIPEQVPAVVRYIHQWLMANESADSRLGRTLLDLTEAQPTDVVIALLRVAPTCDR